MVFVDEIGAFIAMLRSLMLPMVDKFFSLGVVLIHDLLQHLDRHFMLLRELKLLDDNTSSWSINNEGQQDDS